MKIQKITEGILQAQYYPSGKKSLIIIFPGAGYTSGSLDAFVKDLRATADVLLITGGYLGISPIAAGASIEQYQRTTVNQNLSAILHKIPHKSTYLVGSSVGCIYAISFWNSYTPKTKLALLVSPPIVTNWYARTLHFVLKYFVFNRSLGPLVEKNSQIVYSLPVARTFADFMKRCTSRVGWQSFFLCLLEIVHFTLYERDVLTTAFKDDKLVAIGEKDPVMHYADKQEFMRIPGSFHSFDCGHAVLCEVPGEVASLLQARLAQSSR